MRPSFLSSLAVLFVLSVAPAAWGQPVGWTVGGGFRVQESSGTTLTDYQVKLTIDTQTPIASGAMQPTGADLRAFSDCGYTTQLPLWIDPATLNTAATDIWVKVPTIPANGQTTVYYAYGNPTATTVSSVDAVFTGPFSSTDQVDSGGAGGVGNSQRGFRFSPHEDVLVTSLGKREPTGTQRYVTVFDFNTQAIISQGQVSGPAATYSYVDVPNPFWLRQGTQYLLELYQDTSDGYYFGNSSQINAHLTYYDMRYCNSCTQNSFPTNVLSNYHYGYPDLHFYIRQHASVEPSVSTGCTETATCDSDCTPASCGDGVSNTTAGEQCDDGNTVETDACRNSCKAAACGDGIVESGVEQCDDGNTIDTDACRNTCETATCGDGVVYAGVEQCDDGNTVDTDACRNTCVTAACGDGVVQTGVEACDDGNMLNTDGCTNTCALPSCGDGYTEAGVEQCDDMNTVDTDACRNNCMTAICGDGVVYAGVEQCDDMNTVDTDACRNNCTTATCGDGVVQAGVEQCDDGNTVDTDACRNSCMSAACGDGVVQAGVEACDDGNLVSGDGCSSTCTVETPDMTTLVDLATTGDMAAAPDQGSMPASTDMADPTVPNGKGSKSGCSCSIGGPRQAPPFASGLLGLLGLGALLVIRRRLRAQ